MSWFHQNIEVIIGVVIGAIAHFGAYIKEGRCPPPLYILGYTMQLGAVLVFAVGVTESLNLDSTTYQIATGGSLALGANEVVKFIKNNGWKRFLRPWMGEIEGPSNTSKDDE